MKDEALKMALEALEIQLENSNGEQKYADAIAEIKALAQPVQEPWVGLTNEYILLLLEDVIDSDDRTFLKFARDIEQALKEKNP